jgi:hypothetical protein
MYPPDWPRCPACGDFALDGKATCGRVECIEAQRGELAPLEFDCDADEEGHSS